MKASAKSVDSEVECTTACLAEQTPSSRRVVILWLTVGRRESLPDISEMCGALKRLPIYRDNDNNIEVLVRSNIKRPFIRIPGSH